MKIIMIIYLIATRIPPTPIGGLDAWRLRGFDAWKDWKATVLGKALLSWNSLGSLLGTSCSLEAWKLGGLTLFVLQKPGNAKRAKG